METGTLSASSSSAMEEAAMQGQDDGAQPEGPVGKAAMAEAHPEGTPADDDDEDEDEEDDINVHIGAIHSSPAAGGTPNFNRRFSKGGGGAKAAAAAVAAAENGDAVEKQKTTIDLDAEGNINGMPVKEFDLDAILDKPWRKPGADITDYFNYGFNEHTWKAYCTKQQSLRVSNGLPAIGHPNFAPDRNSLTSSDNHGGLGSKKPLVIDMNKIREKFNILGDRGAPPVQPKIKRLDFKMPDAGPSSIAVIGGSDSTSRRMPSSQDSISSLGIPTLGGGGASSSLSKPDPQQPSPFLPGLDMSRPPPGFPPMGTGIPSGPPPPSAAGIPSFPPQVGAGVPPYGAPPPFGDPYGAPGAPLTAQFPPPPMSGPPGSSAQPVPSGWPPQMPPAGPPPLGFPIGPAGGVATGMPPALQRSASPTVKEEEEEEEEDRREHRRGHSSHRESSRLRSSSPDDRRRSRSPSSSRALKDAAASSSSSSKHHRRDKDRKRGADDAADAPSSSSSSRSHHKKSKKSDKDKDRHDDVKREME